MAEKKAAARSLGGGREARFDSALDKKSERPLNGGISSRPQQAGPSKTPPERGFTTQGLVDITTISSSIAISGHQGPGISFRGRTQPGWP